MKIFLIVDESETTKRKKANKVGTSWTKSFSSGLDSLVYFLFQTLSWRDLQYHISIINSLHYYKDLKHNTVIPSRLGSDLVVTIPSNATSHSQSEVIKPQQLYTTYVFIL